MRVQLVDTVLALFHLHVGLPFVCFMFLTVCVAFVCVGYLSLMAFYIWKLSLRSVRTFVSLFMHSDEEDQVPFF